MTKKYQLDYASGRAQMYNQKSREEKAKRIVKLLENYLGFQKLKNLTVLDLGASTGIIANYLSNYFSKVTATDIDKDAILSAKNNFKKKNLNFKIDDALNLSFPSESFDIIICTHIYEHVPNPKKLFKEIYRVLKPGGVCYLAAVNSLWPIEPHYDLPFLSYLPKNLANVYVNFAGKAKEYYETPTTYWGLQKLASKFKIIDYTPKILQHPKKLGYNNIPKFLHPVSYALSPILRYLAPTFFWLLVKEKK